jgi:hypothetical protein
MIIDCHCHAGKGDGLTGPWDTAAPLKQHMLRAGRAGIDRTVLFAAFHSDYAVANRAVGRIVVSHPDRFYGFAFIHAARDRGRVLDMVREGVEKFGFVGIKVHRYDARISREICEAARAFSLPVLYDPIGEVSTVELVATEYPDVAFIIPHLSSFSDDWRAQLAMIDRPVSGGSICWNRRCGGPVRARCCSGRTGLGCIPASNLQRSMRSIWRRKIKHWCSAATSCG